MILTFQKEQDLFANVSLQTRSMKDGGMCRQEEGYDTFDKQFTAKSLELYGKIILFKTLRSMKD